MAYKRKRSYKKKPYKKRSFKKRRKTSSSFKDKVIKIVNKGREKKRIWCEIDEATVDPYSGQVVANWTGANGNSYVPNSIIQGDKSFNRTGKQLQPLFFKFDGLLKFSGEATNSIERETLVRVAFGFLGPQIDPMSFNPANLVSQELILKSGTVAVLQNNHTDLYADFNWKIFRPFYNRVFAMAPGIVTGSAYTTYWSPNQPKDYRRFKFIHNFGKNARSITYPSDTDNDYLANSKNIVMLVITRVMTDDTVVSTLDIEMTGFSQFCFTDA